MPHALFEIASGRDVVDHREQQATASKIIRVGRHLDRTNGAVGQGMTEDKVVAPFAFGQCTLRSHLIGIQGIDLLDAHRLEGGTFITVEIGCRRIGVDNLPAGGVDQQHHRVVLIENLPEIWHLSDDCGGEQSEKQDGLKPYEYQAARH